MKRRVEAGVLVLVALSVGFLEPPQDEQGEEAGSLLGRSPDAVIARHGVPHECVAGRAAITFVYDAKGGGKGEFHVHEDVVVSEPGADFTPARRVVPQKGKAHSGMRARAAAPLLGRPGRVLRGASPVLRADYPSGRKALFVHGRVILD